MRRRLTRESLNALMKELARSARKNRTYRIFLLGGGTAVVAGWRESTIDAASAIVQRLGYLLDLHGAEVPDEVRAALVGLVLPESKIQLGPRRRWGTTGKLVRPWNVVENVPRDVLVPKDEKPRRRMVFSETVRKR